jgi:Mrp family chromosome partitioning ATPase
VDSRGLLKTLRQERLAAVIAFVVIVVAAFATARSPETRYSATTTLFVRPSSSDLNTSIAVVQFLMPALEEKTSSLETATAVQTKLGYDSIDWSASGTADPGTGILRVTVTSSKPDVPVAVANAYPDALDSYLTNARVPVTVSVLDPATAAVSVRNRRLLSLGISALVLGLAGAVLTAVVVGRLRRPRRLPDEIRERFQLPVLAEIPRIGLNVNLNPADIYSGAQQDLDAFMQLRANVEIQVATRKIASLAVVSRNREEGRTLVTSHLVWTLAVTGRKVLALDADIRRNTSRAHQIVGAVDQAASLQVRPTSLPTLSYISPSPAHPSVARTAHLAGPHPAEVVTAALPRALEVAAETGALLVVDAPPILGATEGKYVASVVGAVIVVVDTRKAFAIDDLEETLDAMADSGAVVLGVVLNRTKGGRTRRLRLEHFVGTRDHAPVG